jgi:hypothetical protein
MEVQGVSLSTTSSMGVQGVSFPSRAVWTCRVYVSLFTLVKCYSNARMPDSPASEQSGTRVDKNADAGTSPVPE